MDNVWILITYFMVEIQNYYISAYTKLNLTFILDPECTHEWYWEITLKLFSLCDGKVFQQCKNMKYTFWHFCMEKLSKFKTFFCHK